MNFASFTKSVGGKGFRVPELSQFAWGSISLADLMTELMQAPNGLNDFLQMLHQG